MTLKASRAFAKAGGSKEEAADPADPASKGRLKPVGLASRAFQVTMTKEEAIASQKRSAFGKLKGIPLVTRKRDAPVPVSPSAEGPIEGDEEAEDAEVELPVPAWEELEPEEPLQDFSAKAFPRVQLVDLGMKGLDGLTGETGAHHPHRRN